MLAWTLEDEVERDDCDEIEKELERDQVVHCYFPGVEHFFSCILAEVSGPEVYQDVNAEQDVDRILKWTHLLLVKNFFPEGDV